jgi:hypothetical protein
MPFTFHVTLVSVVFASVALKLSWLPSTIDPFFGVTVTTMEGGGGGGGEPAPPPPQPNIHVPAVRRAMMAILAVLNLFLPFCGKGRMPAAKAGEGPAKRKGMGVRDQGIVAPCAK